MDLYTTAGGGREITGLQPGLSFVGRSMVRATRARGARILGVGRTVLASWMSSGWRLETADRVLKRLGIRMFSRRGWIVGLGDMGWLLYRG